MVEFFGLNHQKSESLWSLGDTKFVINVLKYLKVSNYMKK